MKIVVLSLHAEQKWIFLTLRDVDCSILKSLFCDRVNRSCPSAVSTLTFELSDL